MDFMCRFLGASATAQFFHSPVLANNLDWVHSLSRKILHRILKAVLKDEHSTQSNRLEL